MSGISLAYCSNVHPAETLSGIEATLRDVAARVRDQVAPDGRLGVGLWLSNSVVDEMFAAPERIEAFQEFLENERFDVFTLNAFPFGGFHGARVKEKVFEPTWADPGRLSYTVRCAEVLVRLLPPPEREATGSISTCPLGLPQHRIDRQAAIANLRACGAAFARIEERTGRRIVLGIEPEPSALLETVADATEFLGREVFVSASDPLRRYVGVCFDACHEAIMHQDVESALSRLATEGIALAKLQLSSALEIPEPGRNVTGLERLRAFDEGRYFHQAVFRASDGALRVIQDLAEFFELARDPRTLDGVEKVRVHFHVPIFARLLGPLATTQSELARAVTHARRLASTTHFEIETYTFDVIPAAERARLGAGDLAGLLVREFRQAQEWLA